MKVSDLIEYGKNKIDSKDMNILISGLLNINPLIINTKLNEEVNNDIYKKYIEGVKALQNNIPIQYVLGKWNFYGYEFLVNKDVLIPRFETEELVENTLTYIDKYFDNPKVLDLCTGSGCIGITIAKERPNLDVDISDISDKALDVARSNREKLNANVKIIKSDLLESITDKYDVIISNPPYIGEDEEIDAIVKENEPEIALFGGKNGLLYYERILSTIEKNLKEKYLIAFEIGEKQAQSIIDIANKYLNNITITVKKDQYDRDRMLFIFKNTE